MERNKEMACLYTADKDNSADSDAEREETEDGGGGVALIVQLSRRMPPVGVGSMRSLLFTASTATTALFVPSSGMVSTTWRVRLGNVDSVDSARYVRMCSLCMSVSGVSRLNLGVV